MDHAKYEQIKASRLAKDMLKRQKKVGRSGHLAKKIAARKKHIERKRRVGNINFEGKKQARINREHGRWDRKSAKWEGKGSKWVSKWGQRAAKFNSRMEKRFN